MKFVFTYFFFLSLLSFAQNIEGKWTGVTTQDPGRRFYFEIDIIADGGNRYHGTTIIKEEETGNYGVIKYNATYQDSVFNFQETEISKEDKSKEDGYWKSNTFFWCIKSGQLDFSVSNDVAYLTGPWKSTGTCKPGTIAVSKAFAEEKKYSSIDDCLGNPKSADFLYGMWTGKFTQYACGINGTYDMILMIDEVDGLKFSGVFIWPASQFSADSRSKLKGEIVGNKIYISEPSQISGDPLVIGGIYTSTLIDCDHMKGFWHMKTYGSLCNDPQVLKDGGNYKLNHYVIPTIYFPHKTALLTQESIDKLDELAKFMKTFKNLKIQLKGFTDNTQNNAFNIRMSEERTKVVRDYLIAKGIASYRMKLNHFGSMEPAESNDTEKGQVLNRRTEIEVIMK